ncbi:hypothetical protein FSP39_006340 [Pinctada imbricata]|uniref:Galectin n=1 Tax=Pinctada imbricata TaxID=66713 RepID=A0AA88YLU4_PINIB|nr:hypothetical protein FSP39_006340 [Pinctada imbricata]
MGNVYIIFSLILNVIHVVDCKGLRLHALSTRAQAHHDVKTLSNATDGKAVVVKPGFPLSLNFCIRKKATVTLNNMRFSNFNVTTFVNVSLDHGTWMGTYYAPPQYNWNRFFDTGRFPKKYEFESGWHVLKIEVIDRAGNNPGIALDTILFDVMDPWMDENILKCHTICIPEGSFPFKKPRFTEIASPARIEQRSFETKCAEVDNVDIPIYHPFIESYMISASMPQYNSFSNRRSENLTHCPHLPPQLWRFDDFRINASSRDIRQDGKDTIMMFYRNPEGENTFLLMFRFKLDGQSKGSVDSKIGSLLHLQFRSLPTSITVKMRYRGKHGNMSTEEIKKFDSKNLNYMWTIPDFTWTEDDYNYITLTIVSSVEVNFFVDNVRLEKRPFKPEKLVTIYQSDDVHIVVGYVEMWWLAPESMTVRLSNGQSHEGVAYIQFYRPIPWNNGYAQVFVLYQDGNARLVPITPEGLDWIPFGTSVIIGQPYTDSIRPYASITQLDIDPENWQLKVYYKDGGSVNMKLNSTYRETQVFVYDINFTKDIYTHPFATVRSMYVTEGNTDVDSVKIDDKTTYHVMDQWAALPGRSFAFYRRCISTHLTLSPDIQIDVLRSHPAPPLLQTMG